ncbi:asparagine-linked glycosylation 9 protein isoform a [Schizopora paradoxa]|uniref:Mannosyltransferase n=1 Tax=Schizopora paradoxa TaxID=27342 RepID=A0A0H2RQ45_9AGAM|nr:asparagine-linked glycosylation 9 protein isoform a [Schizopora paradoxa]
MSSGGAKFETIRFQRPAGSAKPSKKPVNRHGGILQDQVRRAAQAPWCPSFSLAVRILLLIRVSGAMYSNISDCDEVYNFWEPLHYLAKGYGFQTWELSPVYAIRSWAYVFMHLHPATLPSRFLGLDKRASFFALRIFFAIASSICEAKLYRAVMEHVNYRVGRYLFFILLFSAGMWNSATAFLPSTFAMFTTTLAFSFSLRPPSASDWRRTLSATLLFATGAIVGWPFSLALALPFVLEELLMAGLDKVDAQERTAWFIARFLRLVTAGLCAALILIPVVGIDSLAYGRLVIAPWQIISYNIFGGAQRGPELYGTEPPTFYFHNLLLNFNIVTPFALLSLPALFVTYFVDRKRLGGPLIVAELGSKDAEDERKPVPKRNLFQSSSFVMLGMRLAPFYLWFVILTMQPHKEERFMFPAYPLIAFNGAVTLYLIRGWLETGYIKFTKSPYRASKTSLFSTSTLAFLTTAILLSLSRIFALSHYYHAPLEILHTFHYEELPRVLNATGLLPLEPAGNFVKERDRPAVNLGTRVGELNLTLCYGKEWYRFPSHWLVPDGVRVEFIKSEFDGLLPRHFVEAGSAEVAHLSADSLLWKWPATRYTPSDLNDMNEEEPSHYVRIKSCHYLIDVDFPKHPATSKYEPRYTSDEANWERVECRPFLDAASSPMLTRAFWTPLKRWQDLNSYGDYCLLKRKDFLSKPDPDHKSFIRQIFGGK